MCLCIAPVGCVIESRRRWVPNRCKDAEASGDKRRDGQGRNKNAVCVRGKARESLVACVLAPVKLNWGLGERRQIDPEACLASAVPRIVHNILCALCLALQSVNLVCHPATAGFSSSTDYKLAASNDGDRQLRSPTRVARVGYGFSSHDTRLIDPNQDLVQFLVTTLVELQRVAQPDQYRGNALRM